jgi:hypothetical protein
MPAFKDKWSRVQIGTTGSLSFQLQMGLDTSWQEPCHCLSLSVQQHGDIFVPLLKPPP